VVAGEPLTLTASIDGLNPTGTVEFFDGATSLGTAAVSGGVAQLTTSSLAVGSHTLSAVYSGDATNTSDTSDDVGVSVLALATVDLAASTSTAMVGDPVTLTATVFGESPTGTVEFFDGATSLGAVALVGGVAELTTNALAAGPHTLGAVYSGDATNTAATSADQAVSVLAEATVDLAASASVVIVGDPITLTATVTGDSPTGTVEFFDGATSLGTITVVGGVAELTVDGLPAGDYLFSAVYSGDPANTTATSSGLPVTVSPPPSAESDVANANTGGEVTITGDNFEAGSEVQIWLMTDTPVLLAIVSVDGVGSFAADVTLPAGILGEFNVEVRGTDAVGEVATVVLDLNIQDGLPATGVFRALTMLAAVLLLAGVLVLLQTTGSRRRVQI
jgi:hypothetical protein